MTRARIEALGDAALLISLGDRIDAELNARTVALADALRAAQLPGVLDIAPAYASVCVRYEPLAWSGTRELPLAAISARVSTFVDNAPIASPNSGSDVIEIPVCYGGDFGPDLDIVAAHAQLPAETVIARHADGDYRVAMLGFAPGFPYLLGLHDALQVARRSNPRTRVPAGSVAIGGAQTGIYPRELPGGWHIIGRTPLVLFDATCDPPALLGAGQRVRFRAIGAEAFAAARQ